MKQLIEIEVDIPDGFRFVRWGKPKAGETSLDSNGDTYTWGGDANCYRIIIERDTPPVKYREPDSRDVGKPCEVLNSDAWNSVFYIGKSRAGTFVCEALGRIGEWDKARVIDDTSSVGEGYRLPDHRDIGDLAQFADDPRGHWSQFYTLRKIDSDGFHSPNAHWKFARVRVS